MGRDLKNRNCRNDVTLLKFNLYVCNYMTCCQKKKKKKNTSRRSKDLVKQRNCQQCGGAAVLWWCLRFTVYLYFCSCFQHTTHIVHCQHWLAGLEPLDVYSTVGRRPDPNGNSNGTVQMYWHEFHWLQPFNALAPGILNNIKFTLTLLNSSG